MADEEEMDRRQWLLSVVRGDKPVENYLDWVDRVDKMTSFDPDEIENHPQKDWLRAT